jgi:hypothetical protein
MTSWTRGEIRITGSNTGKAPRPVAAPAPRLARKPIQISEAPHPPSTAGSRLHVAGTLRSADHGARPCPRHRPGQAGCGWRAAG